MVKRQHYISQGILKSFCNGSGGLYESMVFEKRLYGTSPLNAMCESYTYEHEDIAENRIENDFADLEGAIIPKIDALIGKVGAFDNGNGTISEIKEQMFNLLPSMLIFYYRSNALLQEYSMGDKKFRIPLMLKKILNDKYIFRLAKLIVENYSFCIIKAESAFLISDQYISTAALKIKSVFVDISNRHIGLKDTIILIPLSKDYYVAFWHSSDAKMFGKDSVNRLDKERTFRMNRAIINNSYTKCVGPDEAQLQNMSREWSHQSPTQIFIGHTEKSSSGFTKKKEIFYSRNDEEAFDVLTNHTTMRHFFEATGNDRCPCRDGKLFKNCHMKYVKIARPFYEQFGTTSYIGDITIDGTPNHELPIDSWGPMSRRYQI